VVFARECTVVVLSERGILVAARVVTRRRAFLRSKAGVGPVLDDVLVARSTYADAPPPVDPSDAVVPPPLGAPSAVSGEDTLQRGPEVPRD
jgi:hypothetical protein